MKKNRDREGGPLQADDQMLPTGAAATVPVFLVLALVLFGITVFFRQPQLLPRKHTAPPPAAAAGYVWLTGSSAIPDGLYLLTPELADRFPALAPLPAAQAAGGGHSPVAAYDLAGDTPRPVRLPPAVANIFFQPIPINRADKDILATLPGIGPVLAARIVERRERQGPFRTRDELLQITGIGPGKYAGLVDHITLE